MTQPVTALGSPELASKLEELSGVALQIAHCFNELRAMLPSDLLTNSASACALFHVAISNAHGCLSLLQSVNQAPIPPPYVVPSSDDHLIDFPVAPHHLSYHHRWLHLAPPPLTSSIPVRSFPSLRGPAHLPPKSGSNHPLPSFPQYLNP